MAATRPTPNNLVKELYSFEVLSSTEWSFPLRFSPNTFFRVVPYLDTKIKAMQAYSSELRIFPHPRSIKSIQLNAELWGTKVGLGLAEAFINIRNLN
jgi:LmbE family N-acetylglucosaminyl deacetylase